MKRKKQKGHFKEKQLDCIQMKQFDALFHLHSSLSLLVDSFLSDPEYRAYVPRLNQVEYLADQLLIENQRTHLNGKTKANRTISQVLSRTD